MIRPPSHMLRRDWLRLLLSAFPVAAIADRLSASPAAFLERVMKEGEPHTTTAATRRYRADAIISFFSVSLFSRTDVGGGYMVVENLKKDDWSAVALQFAAGSNPGRTRGLNRLGFFEELVTEKGSAPVETSYFGFMTSSKEESFAQAKKALEASGSSIPYTAAQGSGGADRLNFSVHQLQLPSTLTYADAPELIERVRTTVEKNSNVVRQGDVVPDRKNGTPRTFLYSL
ncbi:MAG TPA: hypothetical protein VE621_22740, partial [Bryobacteraceae bacterium]|nr:hypothetical protein [Bryobacteraceae bacterium]